MRKVIFTVAGKDYHLGAGRLHYVNFSNPHYVRNDGDEARVHLVLDLKVNEFLEKVFPPLTAWQKNRVCVRARNLSVHCLGAVENQEERNELFLASV